jgi:hypothetical protein
MVFYRRLLPADAQKFKPQLVRVDQPRIYVERASIHRSYRKRIERVMFKNRDQTTWAGYSK